MAQLLRVFTFGIAIISLFVSVQSAPTKGSQALARNAQEAQTLNVQFQTLKATDSCQSGDKACLSGGVAVCRNGTWDDSTGKCSKSQQCFALPSTTDSVLVTCTTESSALSAFQAAGVQGGIFGSGSNNNSTTAATTTTAQTSSQTSKTNNNSSTTTTTTTTTAHNGSKTSKTNSTTIAKAGGNNKGDHTRSTQVQPTKTVTVVVGTQPTTLPPVTRTLTPQEAVNEMLRIMQAGATIVGQPSPTKTAHHKS